VTANSSGSVVLDPRAHADGSVDEVFGSLRGSAPVVRYEPDDFPPFWSVVTYREVKEVYTNPDVYGSTRGVLLRRSELGEDPGGGLTLALTDRPRHAVLRRLLAPLFDERCARNLHATMRQDVCDVLEEAAQHDVVDLAHAVSERLSSYLVARLLSVPDADVATVCRWIGESFADGRPITSHPLLAPYLIELVYDRMERPHTDLVSLLVEGDVDGEPLSETEILLNVENVVGASENAGLSLASGLLALMTYPDQLGLLVERRELIGPACEEVLRWASSASHSMRFTRADAQLAGVTIPAGERVVVWLRSANRDERVFEAGGEFRVDRGPNRHVALGVGEHVCIGQTMARHQMRMVLEEVRQSVESMTLAGEVEMIASIAVNGPSRLPVKLKLRGNR
jgi:cytochrome P450